MITAKMSKTSPSCYKDIDTTGHLFEHLSLSVDNKLGKYTSTNFSKQYPHAPKPKFRPSATAYCIKCKQHTVVISKAQCIPEKEVDVQKESHSEKQVKAGGDAYLLKYSINSKNAAEAVEEQSELAQPYSLPVSESAPLQQSVFLQQRPSIVGNNDFWLPRYSVCEEQKESFASVASNPVEEKQADAIIEQQQLVVDVTSFLKNIFKQTTKARVKVLQVETLLDGRVVVLTDEYLFLIQLPENNFQITEALALKDITKVMVNDTSSLFVLAISRAQTQIEFREFVAGHPEKTESLISFIVHAVSRTNNFLPSVTRLPLWLLPTCNTIQSWFVRQNEQVVYSGFVFAENTIEPAQLEDQIYMMSVADTKQFHPVKLYFRIGCVTTMCNGGCVTDQCKYSLAFRLNQITIVRRENNPWPHCVRLVSESLNVTLAGSCKTAADELVEKLYTCTALSEPRPDCVKSHAYAVVSEYTLQLFKMTVEKEPLIGSPLLNLEISVCDEKTCTIDFQGIEAEDSENIQLQHRWRLTFLDANEKLKFLTAALVQ